MTNSSFEDQWTAEAERWTPRRVKVWIGVLVAICVFGGVALWGFNVVTSDAKGAGDAVIQKNQALNRTQAQALFNTNFQSIKSLDQRLSDAQVQLDAFNKTKQAAQNAETMIKSMPASIQDLARSYSSGSLSLADWRKDAEADCVPQRHVVRRVRVTVVTGRAGKS